jgi:hypothetical protein
LRKKQIQNKQINLSGGSPVNQPMKKIDLFRSTSHVDFLKAHIKLSYLPNFQNFWDAPSLIGIGSKKGCEAHMGTFSSNEIFR